MDVRPTGSFFGGQDQPQTSKEPKLCLRFTHPTSKNAKGRKHHVISRLSLSLSLFATTRSESPDFLVKSALLLVRSPWTWSFYYLSCGASSCTIASKKPAEQVFQEVSWCASHHFQGFRSFSASFLGLLPAQDTFDPDRFIERCGYGHNLSQWVLNQPSGWRFSGFSWVFMGFDMFSWYGYSLEFRKFLCLFSIANRGKLCNI